MAKAIITIEDETLESGVTAARVEVRYDPPYEEGAAEDSKAMNLTRSITEHIIERTGGGSYSCEYGDGRHSHGSINNGRMTEL